MNFTKLMSKINSTSFTEGNASVYSAVISSSPIPTLIKPLLDWSVVMNSRIQGYDALALGLTSADTVLNDISRDALYPDGTIPEVVTVPEEEASAIINGFLEAKEVIAPNDALLTLTSSSGLVYNLQYQDGILSCITADYVAVPVVFFDDEADSWTVRKSWPSTLELGGPSGVMNHDMLSSVQRICNYTSISPESTDIFGMLTEVCDHLEITGDLDTIESLVNALCEYYSITPLSTFTSTLMVIERAAYVHSTSRRIVEGASESFVSIMNSCVDTGTMNGMLIECIDAMKTARLSTWINEKSQWASDSKQCVKQIIKRISTSYYQGGLKGVIYYLYSLLKAQSTIRDENGVLGFTNNSALVPKEYIAGLIGQMVSAVLTTVATIIAMVGHIVLAIITIIGNIAWSIFGSFKQDLNDTYSSLPEFDNSDSAVNMIPYAPQSLLTGEILLASHDCDWYLEFYNAVGSCGVIEVPGGALFIGPGGFNDAGEISKVRFEFHPSCAIYNRSKVHDYFCDFLVPYPIYGFKMIKPNTVWHAWRNLISDADSYVAGVSNDSGTGHLSSANDALAFGSIAFSTAVFCYWLTCVQNGTHRVYDDEFCAKPGEHGTVLSQGVKYAYPGDGDVTASWSPLIDLSVQATGGSVGFSPFRIYKNVGGTWTDFGVAVVIPDTGYALDSLLGHLTVTVQTPDNDTVYNVNIGHVIALPDSPVYGINIPRYNANTFWTWITLSLAVTAVITVSTVVCATKFAKWRKFKQAQNVAKFNAAQSDYQNAISGVKTEIDPETGEVVERTFDVNTEEGQQYIKSCYKTYKTTAFKNNMLANIIGGSRYDITTFYGEAEVDSDASSESSILDSIVNSENESMYGVDNQGEESAYNNSGFSKTDLDPVITLIKGVA